MVDLNAHEAGNGGEKPREAYSPLSLLYSESHAPCTPDIARRDPPPSGVLRPCTAVPHAPPAEHYAPVENRGCVRRTSAPSASAEPATPPAGRTHPARKECLTGALPDRPASGFPPAGPAAVGRFRYAAVPRFPAHAALATPGVRRRSSRPLPGSLYWP
jgi:hypothetical protein